MDQSTPTRAEFEALERRVKFLEERIAILTPDKRIRQEPKPFRPTGPGSLKPLKDR